MLVYFKKFHISAHIAVLKIFLQKVRQAMRMTFSYEKKSIFFIKDKKLQSQNNLLFSSEELLRINH